MREILFRGFAIDPKGTEIVIVNGVEYKGYWKEGFYLEDKWRDSDNNELHFILPDRVKPPFLEDWQPIKVIKETIGQYTGLTDKNGTKIFEGDILQFEYDKGCYEKRQVKIPESYDWLLMHNLKKEWKVLGNIHDKELLEVNNG